MRVQQRRNTVSLHQAASILFAIANTKHSDVQIPSIHLPNERLVHEALNEREVSSRGHCLPIGRIFVAWFGRRDCAQMSLHAGSSDCFSEQCTRG